MGRTIRQHYVPKSYLKRFSYDGKRLHTFLISQDTPHIISSGNKEKYLKDISICDVCVGKNFYTIDESNPMNNNGNKALCLEKDFFQDYAEPKLGTVIDSFQYLADKIIAENYDICSIRITEQDRIDLSKSAFIQYFRTPQQRHNIEAVDQLMKLVKNNTRKEEGLEIDDKIKGLDIAYTHAAKTYLNQYLWRAFVQKISSYCLLLRVSQNGNFFTSDNPVVIHKLGAKGKQIIDVNFYKDDFSLFFPLSPYLMLEYYDPNSFPDAITMNSTISMVDVKYEKQVNKYQYINAEKFVFSSKNDFSLFLKPINNN